MGEESLDETKAALPSRMASLKELFHSARDLPVEERGAFLEQACGGDDALRREINALLESDRAAGDFIAGGPAQLAAELFGSAPDAADLGRTIGQYRLLECIGSGGMGTVYLAERADEQFEMRVAIKLIKRGMDTDAVLRRFQSERQILASLDHPNIARLLDGGTTEDGLPYFVMEHIQGERIDVYAQQRELSVTARLELFRQVCGAIAFAHQHLVVHRDLKPSNILVTADGVPKLLDFGIAKIIRAGEGEEAMATLTMLPAMTPEYASPEQFMGLHATTQSDVYSLGAVLYELLSGHPPHRLPTRSTAEITKAITTNQIERPSTVVRGADEARRLRGDLDNIVLMAMRKETARRYRSIEQFSEDIRRHLVGRPVIARPDKVSYRVGKFLHRNKFGVAAAALLLLTLVGGIVATAWQAQRARVAQARAERRFNEVRSLARSVLFDYHDAIKALPGATKVRERLVKDGLNYLDSLAGEAHQDPALQRELADAYERMGEVRGGDSGGNLGDAGGALESHEKALRLRQKLFAANPSDALVRRGLARSHKNVAGFLVDVDNVIEGEEHLGQAQALYLKLAAENPADDDLQLELAETKLAFKQSRGARGDLAGSLAEARAAAAICANLVAKKPREQRYRAALATAEASVAYALSLQGDIDGALEIQEKVLALREALLAEDPGNADYRRYLVTTYQRCGVLREEKDPRAALEYFRKEEALDEKLLAEDPADASIGKDLAFTHKKMAEISIGLNEPAEALEQFRKAVVRYEKVVKDAPNDLISGFLVATCRAGVARMQAHLGAVDLALEECRHATAVLEQITGDNPGHLGRAQANEYLGYAYVALAAASPSSTSETKTRASLARAKFQKALDIIDEFRQQGPLGSNEQWAQEIEGEIAKCDAVLKE